MLYTFIIIILAQYYPLAASANNGSVYFNDRVHYTLSYLSNDQLPIDHEHTVRVTTSDAETYQCVLPAIEFLSEKSVESYRGASPEELIKAIYKENQCSHRIEAFWRFELCHGNFIRQFHEEKDKSKSTRLEYLLGQHVVTPWDRLQRVNEHDQLDPPRLEYRSQSIPYWSAAYTNGTKCDLTGKPRTAVVKYICEESVIYPLIASVNEVETCSYEIIVLTNRICAHPDFKRPRSKDFEIKCYTTSSSSRSATQTIVRPVAYNQFQSDSQFRDFDILKKNLNLRDDASSTLLDLSISIDDDEVDELEGNSGDSKRRLSKDERIITLTRMIEAFFSRDLCLDARAGSWGLKICYRKSIYRYTNSEKADARKQIFGWYSDKWQQAWAKAHPKRARIFDNRGNLIGVTNVYAGGEQCEATDAPRTVEMRIMCRLTGDLSADFAVRILLQEPKRCEYLLVLQSALFCSYMSQFNEYGVYMQETTIEKMLRQAISKIDDRQALKLRELDVASFLFDGKLEDDSDDDNESAEKQGDKSENDEKNDERHKMDETPQTGRLKKRPPS